MKAAEAWTILGLPPGTDRDEVRRVFREKARDAHPDAGGDPEMFQTLTLAYTRALATFEEAPDAESRFEVQVAEKEEGPAQTVEDLFQLRQEQRLMHEIRKEALEEAEEVKKLQQEQSQRKKVLEYRWRNLGKRQEREAKKKAMAAYATEMQKEDISPDVQSMWFREMEMEEFGARWQPREKQQDEIKQQRPSDLVVGARSVNTRDGATSVPVYKATDGSRYYFSPLTSKRVAIP